MNLRKYLVLGIFIGLTAVSCKKDDENTPTVIEYRDEVEVRDENLAGIEAFLSTHFYTMVNNPLNQNYKQIEFDTIAGVNSGKTPVMNSPFLKTKQVAHVFLNDNGKKDSVVYKMYYLQFEAGAASEPKTTFGDQVIVTYRGLNMNQVVFDESTNLTKFDLPGQLGTGGIIQGFREVLTEFRGASTFTENPDNTISFSSDFGVGAVFVPSGLGYFATPPTGSSIEAYEPIMFTFQLYKTIQGDTDNDGIPNIYEDLNGDELLYNDNSDADNIPDMADVDDDNDGTLTKDEIVVDDANGDGRITLDEITFTDSNNDGTPDYRDPEVK